MKFSSESSPLNDLTRDLQRALGEKDGVSLVRTDLTTRVLYSTDASIYQIEPLGVVFPRQEEDLQAIMEACAAYGVPLLPRGSGSSLAGQAIGQAMIVDCSRFLNRLIKIDPESATATVEPGLILKALNHSAAVYGLQFGPDPASSERATMGGCIGNNASGAHSILYGMTSDHIRSAEVVLADGSIAEFKEERLEAIERKLLESDGKMSEASGIEGGSLLTSKSVTPEKPSKKSQLETEIYRTGLRIREKYGDVIQHRWPRTWRNASGYALNYLLPWSASRPPLWEGWGRGGTNNQYPPVNSGNINLAPLLAGSEGTLAIIRRATLNLVPVPHHSVLGVLAYQGIAAACEAVEGLLDLGPSAVELIPQDLIRLARSVPAYARQLSFLDPLRNASGDPPAVLVVEFAGDDHTRINEKVRSLGKDISIAESPEAQRQVWAVRKVGLALLMSRAGDIKPWPFIEDLSVPVERLAEFVRELHYILDQQGVSANFYGHASAGCLHIRPMINLKTAQGLEAMRSIAARAVNLTLSLGGSVSGEHGDGLARSGWLGLQYGKEILTAFKELKEAADPQELLNPGKIVPQKGREPAALEENLRVGPDHRTGGWQPVMDFSSQAGIAGAIEQCNGAGVCRKAEDVMCPSFQATQEEMHSTRGRANLLRAMLSGRFPSQDVADKTVFEALDLCLACKGCKAECPSSVDMAKLKYEFMSLYYQRHRRRLRDYIFAHIETLGRLGYPFAGLLNPLLGNSLIRTWNEKLFGLARQRPLPQLSKRPLRSLVSALPTPVIKPDETLLFLTDAFTEYFRPQIGLAAMRVLQAVGCHVKFIPVVGSGRTLISKGFLEAAKAHARQFVERVYQLDPRGDLPIVGVEPSEIVTLRDEYVDLLKGDKRAESIAGRSFLIDEFLVRPAGDGKTRIMRIAIYPQPETHQTKPKILLHGHCYQKTLLPKPDGFPSGLQATIAMLTTARYQVKVIDSGCCGVAGAFGYESEHYNLSMKIGEKDLLPAVRSSTADVILSTSGVSCQAQIEDGTGRKTLHPIQLIEKLIC